MQVLSLRLASETTHIMACLDARFVCVDVRLDWGSDMLGYRELGAAQHDVFSDSRSDDLSLHYVAVVALCPLTECRLLVEMSPGRQGVLGFGGLGATNFHSLI